jgi:L-asparaginase / beta-aspartyl-peptidase
VIIASQGGEVGLAAGMDLLCAGGSALDAVEAAIRIVESNEADHHVGAATVPDATYSVITADDESFRTEPRRQV